jgi:hypothetical protein
VPKAISVTTWVWSGAELLYIRSVTQELRNPSNGQHVAAPASMLKQQDQPLPPSGAPSLRNAPAELGRYQFQVVAGHIADVVASIGGLIFDRAMAGWDVSVVLRGDSNHAVNDRPIRILGARLAERMSDPDDARALPRPHLLAVAADVMVTSDAVRRHVLALANDSGTDVLLWGLRHPTRFPRTFVAARHQPSAAAQVFKSHALSGVEPQAMRRVEETFYSMT